MIRIKRSVSLGILRLFLSLFFIVLGILGVITKTGFDEGVGGFFSLNNGNLTLEVIFGVFEIICGVVIFLSFFSFLPDKFVGIAILVVLILIFCHKWTLLLKHNQSKYHHLIEHHLQQI